MNDRQACAICDTTQSVRVCADCMKRLVASVKFEMQPRLLSALKNVLAVASANAEDLEAGETCEACDEARAVIAEVEAWVA